jgi:hypothetical protein
MCIEYTNRPNRAIDGRGLHANVSVPAHRRDQLERLIRYTARGAVSLERLEEDANGDLLYTFTRPWSDGTTGIKLSPLELLEKLAALVPLPRLHLVRSGGCLAHRPRQPAAAARSKAWRGNARSGQAPQDGLRSRLRGSLGPRASGRLVGKSREGGMRLWRGIAINTVTGPVAHYHPGEGWWVAYPSRLRPWPTVARAA